MFLPEWPGIFVNPFYIARSGLFDAICKYAPDLSGRLLDVGCGSKPYRTLFSVDEYVGLDIDSDIARDSNNADYYYDGNAFPFDDAAFDSVVCNQVLEHVFNPDAFLQEINRVLKPEGKLLLTVPFVWDEHEQPYDYARYSSFGLRALLEKNRFEVIVYKKIGGDASVIFQLINAYLYKITINLPRTIRELITVFIMGLFNIMGIVSAKFLPKNTDLFLDQIVIAKKAS
jgi:SAM-dependent methyltransferase